MIARVARLVRAEFLKIFSHPFLFISLPVLALLIVGAEEIQPAFRGQRETVWRSLNSIQLFAYGFKFGLTIATFVLLVFSSMAFAGEFDRGTIKNLLTRPITRLDLFTAKCVTTVLLAVLLYLLVFYASLAWALARGDMGPVWDDDFYVMQRDYPEMLFHLRKAALLCFLPFLAAGFLGLLVSNWTESSGYAVAIALMVFLFGDLFTGILGESAKQRVFLTYPSYALDKLTRYAEGEGTRWNADIDQALLYVKVPLAYIAGFLPAAFLIFRSRDIRA